MRLHQATWWFPSRDSRGNTWSNQCRSLSSKTLHTYPLSACADERSFSSMKRIKTSLRNTMTDERLSSLAILHIHNFDKDANVDNVAKFAHQKERRQKMVWWRDDRKPCFFISLCTQGFFFSMSYCFMFIQLCHSFPSLWFQSMSQWRNLFWRRKRKRVHL